MSFCSAHLPTHYIVCSYGGRAESRLRAGLLPGHMHLGQLQSPMLRQDLWTLYCVATRAAFACRAMACFLFLQNVVALPIRACL